ncbi:MAG: 3-hydroxyacyl-CoA dehydrogenase NAD-binding domain-containing protein [Granulosicoccus sp.]
MSVVRRREDRVGYVTLDNPPVNAIGQSVRAGLLEAVRWAEREQLERVIVSGKGAAFAAGADAREFDQAPAEPQLPDVLDRIESSHVPWIAAINGIALGGGAEIAMACRFRIIAESASIGMPEVTLGVIPGAGGTQRLPRLIGLGKALQMITGGKPVSAATALQTGLVHSIDQDPVEAAFMINSEELHTVVPVWELPAPDIDLKIVESARATAQRKSAGQQAPLRAIEVMQNGLALEFSEALKIERSAFLELRHGAQARALRHLFFAQRAAKAPAELKPLIAGNPLPANSHIAVIGGGMMGAGITNALLSAGYQVTVVETDKAAITRAQATIAKLIESSIQRGFINPAEAEAQHQRLNVSHAYEDISNASLAIEAAFESLEVKQTVFKKLDSVLPEDAVVASNTSYLDLNEMARVVRHPSRVIGLHFFAPAHIMKLLEIVRADQSGDDALAVGFSLARQLRKVPVLAGVCDGFIGNRILARYREAADTLLMDGSTPWEIDQAMVEFGYSMGPYEAQDLSGLDIAFANRRRQDPSRDPNRRYIPIADRMVEMGRLGRKTAVGWYRYPGGNGKVEDPIVADLAIEEARFAGVNRVEYSDDQIRERLLLAMINEAADLLHEGIARSAADIDLVSVFGYGFPRWRGGLMHYADTLGVSSIAGQLSELVREDPVAWRISPLLQRCASEKVPLSDC